jgi:acyl-CoA thioesterase FadM
MPVRSQGMLPMSLKNTVSLTTRISDLDSLRHVNNRVYEELCSEGRYRLLEEHGSPIEVLLDKVITLRPVASFVRFARQQKAGAKLDIHTEAFPLGDGHILWNHQITEPDGETACTVQARSATLDRRNRPVELLPLVDEIPEAIHIEDVPDFSGQCSRLSSDYSAIYTDMDAFGNLPLAAHWRAFEEGRHMFGDQVGLTLEELVQLDTHIFWVSGTYQCYKPINPGQQVKIYTWLERMVRIRAYIRQEIRSADGTERLGASREEHLIVSLSKVRPKAAPGKMMEMIQPYVEFKE